MCVGLNSGVGPPVIVITTQRDISNDISLDHRNVFERLLLERSVYLCL